MGEMSGSQILVALLVLVCVVGVLLGDAVASRIALSRLSKRVGKHEVVSAKLFVALSANVAGLRERVEAGDKKSSRPAPPPPPPRPTDPLRRQPDVANDGDVVPEVDE